MSQEVGGSHQTKEYLRIQLFGTIARNLTNNTMKMYGVIEENKVTYNMTSVLVNNVHLAKIEYDCEVAGFFLVLLTG